MKEEGTQWEAGDDLGKDGEWRVAVKGWWKTAKGAAEWPSVPGHLQHLVWQTPLSLWETPVTRADLIFHQILELGTPWNVYLPQTHKDHETKMILHCRTCLSCRGGMLQSNSSHTNAVFNTEMRRPFSSFYHITFHFIDVQQVTLHFLAEHLILPDQTLNGNHRTSAGSFGYTTISRNFSGALTA